MIEWKKQTCDAKSTQCTGDVIFQIVTKRPKELQYDKSMGETEQVETLLCFPCFVILSEVVVMQYGRGFDNGVRMVMEEFRV